MSRRLDRQRIVTRAAESPVGLVALVEEGVLRRTLGAPPAVLVAQLYHLVAMGQRPNVTIGVLPRDASAEAVALGGKGAFVILETPWPGGLVHLEHQGGARSLDAAHEIETYALAFDRLRELALAPAESATRILSAARELEKS